MVQQTKTALADVSLRQDWLRGSSVSPAEVTAPPSTASANPEILYALRLLNQLDLATCAMSSHGQMSQCNDRFRALMPTLMDDRPDRLCFRNPEADAAFAHQLARLKTFVSGHTPISFALKPDKWRTPHIAHLLPGPADPVRAGHALSWLMIVIPVKQTDSVDGTLLEGLFGLTPSEAAIASGLAAGNTLQDVATQRDISVETARTQLKAVMSKTGTNRQAELVGLVTQVRSL